MAAHVVISYNVLIVALLHAVIERYRRLITGPDAAVSLECMSQGHFFIQVSLLFVAGLSLRSMALSKLELCFSLAGLHTHSFLTETSWSPWRYPNSSPYVDLVMSRSCVNY